MSKRPLLTLGLSTMVAFGGLIAAKQSFLFGKESKSFAHVQEVSSYREIARHILPAVASIEAMSKVQVAAVTAPGFGGGPMENMPGLPPEFRKKLEELPGRPFAPRPQPHGRAFGSGFVVDPKGIILTNDHVVRDAAQVRVTLQDGRKFISREIKRDPKTDLAIVRIDAKEPLPYLELGDSDAMEIGDRVLAVGAPLGLTGTVTSGIISAKARDVRMNMYEDFLQTDAAINPGNSGGPLVNLQGQVIGINSAIKSETGGFQGIGLAISSNLVKNVMAQLLKDGQVHRGYLGVQVGILEPEVAARLNVSDGIGVVISAVTANTPAARAGLQGGDIVTTVAGKPVKDPRDLQKIVAGLACGQSVEFLVMRDGANKKLSVTIQEQPRDLGAQAGSAAESPESEPKPSGLEHIGVKVVELDSKYAKEFGYSEDTRGILITEVESNSIADGAGLGRGTLILKVDGTRVRTVEEARKVLVKGAVEKGVVLQVRTPRGGTTYVFLKPLATN